MGQCKSGGGRVGGGGRTRRVCAAKKTWRGLEVVCGWELRLTRVGAGYAGGFEGLGGYGG